MKKIDFYNFYQKIIEAYTMKRRFLMYRKPYDKIVYLCINNDNKKLFSNFYLIIGDFNQKNIINIYPNEIFIYKIDNKFKRILNHNFHINNDNNKLYHDFDNLIKKSLILIRNNILKKVVISRKQEIYFTHFNLKNTIQNLINTSFESFINIWHDPIYGLWIGATPELLFHINKNELLSLALAGTLPINHQQSYNLKWHFKELEEHYIVVYYITNILKKYLGKIFIDQTKTLNTGFIKHLKTSIKFSFFQKPPTYQELLYLLHPTPAICGFPKDRAYNFIKKHEGYNRSFYTGYIGIINKNIAEFYVNLRCVNILDKLIVTYAGCGITNNSNPKDEFLESKIKIYNILSNISFN